MNIFYSDRFEYGLDNVDSRRVVIKLIMACGLWPVAEHAYRLTQQLDPRSEGRGVLQFKTGLQSIIKVLNILNPLHPENISNLVNHKDILSWNSACEDHTPYIAIP